MVLDMSKTNEENIEKLVEEAREECKKNFLEEIKSIRAQVLGLSHYDLEWEWMTNSADGLYIIADEVENILNKYLGIPLKWVD